MNADAEITIPNLANLFTEITNNFRKEFNEIPTVVANDSGGAITQVGKKILIYFIFNLIN